ncbi:hypothetical protein DH2020_035740 [Rehmannia glutinosa]|uniref:Histone-lysine N-methyltransferase n=1 Tax=Rehmannia glutinosa TaxID=99300 RepID=A0ABR0V875_REHGL
MGSNSMAPFGDPNLPSTSTSGLRVPKVEPKLEPFDEPFPYPPHFHLSTPAPTSVPQLFSDNSRISEMFSSAAGQDFQRHGDTPVPPDSDPNSLAIVPVPETGAHLSNVALSPRGSRKYPTRSAELVRVTDLEPEDKFYFRDSIRKTRILFESLRVFSLAEDEKRRDTMAPQRRTRADLKAAAIMREHGLWLNREQRVVGDIPGVLVGDVFVYRMEMCVLGLHGQVQAGIDYVPYSQSSNGEPIATSIIVSGGYEDDEDAGDVIVYTGHGGQDKHNRQVMHQKLESGNLALERSMTYRIEVRVIRGFKYEGSATGKIYVYDGLYKIIETWFDMGRSGFGVYKFKLIRIENQDEMGSTVMKFALSLRTQPLEARPRGYVSLDLSNKKENFPVFFYNDVDGVRDPIYYEYLISTVFPPYVYNYGNVSGCDCVGGCMDDCFCALRNGGEFAYDLNGILIEVFRSRDTDWGVRSLDLIQAGSFICEYAGVVLTPCPSIPPLDFAMDVSRMRNVACYMSHSSLPNVMVQHVLYDHNNISFPHIMLFAMENIPPMRELSLDYGVADEWTGKLAICN